MHLGRRNFGFRYQMNCRKLEVMKEEKDLEVVFTEDLKSSSQCLAAYKKAWFHLYQKDKSLLERVQHCFTRMIPDICDTPYKQRLKKQHLWTQEERLNRADIIQVFKVKNGLSALLFDRLFMVNKETRIRGHSFKLVKRRCRLDVRLYFFAERVDGSWNFLNQKAVDQCSLNGFKNCLVKIREDNIGFFMENSSPSPLASSTPLDVCVAAPGK